MKWEEDKVRDVYQVFFYVDKTYTALLTDPKMHDPVDIEDEYRNQIKSPRDFWERRDDLNPEYGLGDDSDLEGSGFGMNTLNGGEDSSLYDLYFEEDGLED